MTSYFFYGKLIVIMKKASTSRENNSFYLIQDIIDREVRDAFRIRLSKDEEIAVALNKRKSIKY